MPTFTMTKTWADTEILNESDLDNIKDDTEAFLNTTKIDSDNIQTGGVNANSLASNAVITAKINAAAVTTAKLDTAAVTTAKITDDAVTDDKIDSATVPGFIFNNTTRDVVTSGTVVSPNVAISGASGNFSTTAATFVDVTNLSVTITTSGRPVQILLTGDGTPVDLTPSGIDSTEQGCYFGWNNSSGGANGAATVGFRILRDSTSLIETSMQNSTEPLAPNYMSRTSIEQVDGVAAGTYTYKFQAVAIDGTSSSQPVRVQGMKLVAYEI